MGLPSYRNDHGKIRQVGANLGTLSSAKCKSDSTWYINSGFNILRPAVSDLIYGLELMVSISSGNSHVFQTPFSDNCMKIYYKTLSHDVVKHIYLSQVLY